MEDSFQMVTVKGPISCPQVALWASSVRTKKKSPEIPQANKFIYCQYTDHRKKFTRNIYYFVIND